MPREVPDLEGRLLLGIDIGSSGVKAVLLDPQLGIVASARHDVSLFSDHPGWAEAEPLEWWSAVRALVPLLLAEASATSADVAAVAVTGMVPAVLCVDEHGRTLRRAILQNDARATDEIHQIADALADVDLLALTGSVLSQQSVAPTALWLSRHEPDVWSQSMSLQGSYDWMAHALGARAHVEHNWAIESGLYDLDLRPLERVQAATGIRWPAMLDVKMPGTIVGEVSGVAAEETGLRAGTPIVVGGADHVLSAYGAGLVDEGDCLIKLGGATDILVVSDSVFLDARLYLDSHPIAGKWLPNGCTATSGSLLRWEQSIFDMMPLDELDAAATTSQPGALLALPYFLGEKTPLHDPDLRGVLVGLNLATTRGDIHRSFLEGIAYAVRAHFDVFAERGLRVGTVRITNGGSKSRLWREILADVLGRDLVSIVDHPGASFGAAVIAGVGVGRIADWSYVKGALAEGEVVSPDERHLALYEERYQQYRQLSEATTPILHVLARGSH
jgi:xylulokinase